MIHTRYAFIKAQWHHEIVDQALVGFQSKIPARDIDVYDVPGAVEIPLLAQKLASSGKYAAVIGAAFVVDGGIYRHDFVAQSVVQSLINVGLTTHVPILSVVLTPHHYQETGHHDEIFKNHFVIKGQEAAQAAVSIVQTHAELLTTAPQIKEMETA